MTKIAVHDADHDALVEDVVALIEAGRAAAARSVNALMTATYWRVGQVIVEREQRGARRAEYGGAVLERLAETLTARYGRGFSRRNLDDMRRFYLAWPIRQTLAAKSIRRTVSAKSEAPTFDLPWSHYVRLLSVNDGTARAFYETEALRGGWPRREAPSCRRRDKASRRRPQARQVSLRTLKRTKRGPPSAEASIVWTARALANLREIDD